MDVAFFVTSALSEMKACVFARGRKALTSYFSKNKRKSCLLKGMHETAASMQLGPLAFE